MNHQEWSENVILVDADYIDNVTFNLIVNFERMLMRRIPKADFAKWIDCIALDGGLREGAHTTQVLLIHENQNASFRNFSPSDYEKELNGIAFKDNLGEFQMAAYPVDDIVSKEDYFMQALDLIYQSKDVKRLMIVPDCEKMYNKVRSHLNDNSKEDDNKHITVFAMEPLPGGDFKQEILGYSLMAALGIRGEEINDK
jgi:hypothetical protein